jgi:hypothetical protein
MPMQRDKYPRNWKQISQRIRFDRAGNKCEQCGVANGSIIMRSGDDPSRYLVLNDEGVYCTPSGDWIKMSEIPSEYADSKDIRVVLTVAHLDHNTSNNDEGNLKALCQRCHLLHDLPLHIANRKRTMLDRKQDQVKAAGQQELFT